MQPFRKGACAAFASAFVAIALSASPSHRLQVDAYRSPDADHSRLSYRLALAPNMAPVDGISFTDLSAHVRAALAAKGMYEAPTGLRPEVEIAVDFTITERTEPANYASMRFRPVTAHVRTINVSINNEDGKTTTVQQRVEIPTNHGRTDRRRIPTVVVREKHLVLCAREIRSSDDGQPARELWRVHVVNKDEGRDVRAYAPVMVSAAVDGIGLRSDTPREVALKPVAAQKSDG